MPVYGNFFENAQVFFEKIVCGKERELCPM